MNLDVEQFAHVVVFPPNAPKPDPVHLTFDPLVDIQFHPVSPEKQLSFLDAEQHLIDISFFDGSTNQSDAQKKLANYNSLLKDGTEEFVEYGPEELIEFSNIFVDTVSPFFNAALVVDIEVPALDQPQVLELLLGIPDLIYDLSSDGRFTVVNGDGSIMPLPDLAIDKHPYETVLTKMSILRTVV